MFNVYYLLVKLTEQKALNFVRLMFKRLKCKKQGTAVVLKTT